MPVELYNPGSGNARRLIRAGNVNTSSSWSMSAADENRILGDPPDWTEYGRWHLGRETSAERDTKAGWRYPYGKGGRVYRSALIAIRSRSAQQGLQSIFNAAGRLLNLIDGEEESKMRWYDMRAQGTGAEIYLYGDIALDDSGQFGEIAAKQFIDELNGLKVDDITLRINSRGGGVRQGIAIYNALLRHPAQVLVVIDSLAGSIASVIAMAGDLVTIADTAQIMIHDPWTMAQGNSQEFRKLADDMDKIRDAMATAYMRRWKGSRDDLLAAMAEETLYNADQAVELGLADDIFASDIKIAAMMTPAAMPEFKEPAEPEVIKEVEPMATETTAAQPAPEPAAAVNVVEIEAAALRKDKQRREAIAARFAGFPQHRELMHECQDDTSCNAEQAAMRLLDMLGKGAEPIGKPQHVEVTADARDKYRAGAVEWLLAKAGKKDHAELKGSEFRGMSLLDIARECAENAGVRTRGVDQLQLVKAAFTHSTSDFSTVMEDLMHKTLLDAYNTASDTWRRWCSVGTVSDFRTHNFYKVSSFGALDTVPEGAEYQYGTYPDAEKETYSATTKGKLVSVTRQAIINDDLGYLVNLTSAMGRAAARGIETDVYTTLTSNSGVGPVMGDTVNLFDAGHGNIGTGGAISVTTVDEARQLMVSQLDPGGNDYLDIPPGFLLCPDSLRSVAIQTIGAEYDPSIVSGTDPGTASNVPNPIRNLVEVISTPRLSGTRWYIMARPSDLPTIQVSFLNGMQSPTLEEEEGFDIDGVRYKVRLDYGVNAVDWRGAVTNAGA